MIRLIIIILIITAVSVNAQTDWQRWSAEEISYELKQTEKSTSNFYGSGFISSSVSALKNTYKFLISDLDGDNCPFHPSCSNFFQQSVYETNIFQGALMFADRFTRDLNIFKKGKYPQYKSGKYYDPVNNYKLSANEIIIIPSNQIVNQ
ncbi:MAG: membrane protein insertion efficiency factor YidD [Bacteroidetes bacterium]|nr:membrane protein insertion efficiency factor YidD [Bacteroidota bacterium]